MWIHNQNIFLKVKFKHNSLGASVSCRFLDANQQPLQTENLSRIDNNIQTVSTQINMPAVVYLVLDKQSFKPVTVYDISLGNISFNQTILPNVYEYKMNYEQQNYSIDEILDLGSHKTTELLYSGIMCFNFFDIDPVSYHLHLGNKIQACNGIQ